MQSLSHWPGALPVLSINIQDGTTDATNVAVGSAFSTSTITDNFGSILEVFRAPDPGLLQPVGVHAATRPLATANGWLGSQDSSFHANNPAIDGAPLSRLWENPHTANAMLELSDSVAWSRFMELDSDSVSPHFFVVRECRVQHIWRYSCRGSWHSLWYGYHITLVEPQSRRVSSHQQRFG